MDRGMASSVLGLARGRKAIVVLDADVRRNTQVFEAGRLLREHLRQEGATEVTRLAVLGPENTGIDDVLGARADPGEHLVRLIELADAYTYPAKDRPKRAERAATGPRPVGTVPPPTEPVPCARAFLKAAADAQGRTLYRYWREGWTRYDVAVGHWVELADRDAMTTTLYQAFATAIYQHDGQPMPWNPTRATVGEVEAALRADPAVRVPGDVDMPRWVGKPVPGVWDTWENGVRPEAREFLSFPNGLLHLPSRRFVPPDPDLFSVGGVTVAYDPTVTLQGTRWAKWVREVFTDDAESAYRLQEVMGYLVSGRTDLEKLFLLTGVPRAGKGTVGEVLSLLLSGGVSGTSIDGLSGGTFALEPLLNKTLVIIGDARAGSDKRRTDAVVERLLSISGGDGIRVDRKFKSAVNGKLPVNFLIISNEDLILEESSGAMAERFEAVEFRRSFLGHEDTKLKRKLATELPAILTWCLAGLERLDSQGGVFTQSERYTAAREEMKRAGAPHTAFAEDRLVFDPTGWVAATDLYQAWVLWAGSAGIRPDSVSSAVLSRNLIAANRARLVSQRKTDAGKQRSGLLGVRLLTTSYVP